MTTRCVLVSSALLFLSACGGATAAEPATATAETAATAVTPSTPTAVVDQPPALPNEQVVGLWCQYWIPPAGSTEASPSRSADSEQYLFLADGRFGWRAETTAGQEPRKRNGQWRVSGSAIVLTDASGQVIEQLAIAECPSNPEAEQVDQKYRCHSLNGHAFWFSKPADSVDAALFVE